MKSLIFVPLALFALSRAAPAADVCQKYGPQTPRDITDKRGANPRAFALAPAPTGMNLCNVHFHAGAEHKGPAFKVPLGDAGFKCNDTAKLSPAELKDDSHGGHGACHGVKPGDTIEVHWVFSSCDVAPGKDLAACSSESCANPTLRVESQVFLLVNSDKALKFSDFDYGGAGKGGFHQPKKLPSGGTPVVFRGSTTGPKYTEQACSPLQVTWSVRPTCAKLDINSLHHWCEHNVFQENHGHGVRKLVTEPVLLDKIK